jgi:hypothetical protein
MYSEISNAAPLRDGSWYPFDALRLAQGGRFASHPFDALRLAQGGRFAFFASLFPSCIVRPLHGKTFDSEFLHYCSYRPR